MSLIAAITLSPNLINSSYLESIKYNLTISKKFPEIYYVDNKIF